MHVLLQYIFGCFICCFSPTTSRTSDHNQSVFLVDDIKSYCDMKCEGKPHTLCPDVSLNINYQKWVLLEPIPKVNPTSQCSTNTSNKLHLYPVRYFHDLVINGHNGLRNRVAIKYGVSNMRRMVSSIANYTCCTMSSIRRHSNIYFGLLPYWIRYHFETRGYPPNEMCASRFLNQANYNKLSLRLKSSDRFKKKNTHTRCPYLIYRSHSLSLYVWFVCIWICMWYTQSRIASNYSTLVSEWVRGLVLWTLDSVFCDNSKLAISTNVSNVEIVISHHV